MTIELPAASQALYIAPAAALALFVLERFSPLRKPKSALAGRLFVNAVVTALALTAALLVVKPIATSVLQLASEKEWGLAAMFSDVPIVQVMFVFLLTDLTFYYWHRANHAWPILWRFHNAHHIDPDLDVTTAVRFHFVEICLSAAFRAVQVMLIGGPAWAYLAYETVFQLNTLFHHSNVRLPIVLERWLNLVIVTPRMHGIHHSKAFDEVNSNWSSVFSWWDRLHGTLRVDVPQSKIDIGVPGYSLPRDNSVRAVLAMPFAKQRPYWPDSGLDAKRTAQGEKRMRLAE
jgi:sterol desaturase/sphingolipid hydroxylase (fatty acid hydroxylase superfamily)